MPTTSRSSNFELLRIVAMFMVVIHHLVIKGAATCGYTTPYTYGVSGYNGLIINGLALGGVNLFVLISGWFGIRKLWKQIVRLIIDCAVYCAIADIVLVLLGCYDFNVKQLVSSSLFTHNWYVVAFIMLVLISPMLEAALAGRSAKELGYWVLLLTIFNVFFGWMLQNMNTNGYNVVNFAYLYVVARWLRSVSNTPRYSLAAKFSIPVYVICSVVLAFGYIFYSEHVQWSADNTMRYFAYNNPLVVLSSVAVFVFFSRLNFQSKIVNMLATGTFGVFLLHTTPMAIPVRNDFFGGVFHSHGYFGLLIGALLLYAACMAVSVYVERVKRMIPTKHISQTV